MRDLLSDPRFRRLLVGEAFSTFGDSALYLTLGIWVKTLTHSNAAAGSVFLALGLPTLLSPFLGHLADHVRRKPLLICTDALTAALVLSLLAVRSPAQVPLIYVVAFGYGISLGLTSSASAGLRRDLLASEQLAGANAALKSVAYGVQIVSPLVGAGLFAALGGGSVAILDAATFAIAIVALVAIRVEESQPQHPQRSLRRELTAGFSHLRDVPLLGQVTLLSGCAFCVLGLNETILFAVLEDGLHRPASFYGVCQSVQGAGSIAGGFLVTSLLARLRTARTTGLALALLALGSLGSVSDSVVVVLTGLFLVGIAVIWLVATVGTALQLYTPPRLQGRVSAAFSMSLTGPQTLSIAAGAALISFVSYRVLVLVVFAVIGACAAFLLKWPAAEPEVEASRGASLETASPIGNSSVSYADVDPSRVLERSTGR